MIQHQQKDSELIMESKNVVCDKCSVSLESMKCLEKHMKDKHNDNDDNEPGFYCSECGVLKATKKQLQNHERSHKTAVCPSCRKVLPLWNSHRHIKSCRGQIHGPFQCEQCGKATPENSARSSFVFTSKMFSGDMWQFSTIC